MKMTARLVHGVAFCAALIGLTSFGATEAALWKGDDLAEGVTKNGMMLHLNGNTASSGVITINGTPVYIDTGMSAASANAGTETTVIVTLSNVSSYFSGGFITLTTGEQQDAMGVQNRATYGHGASLYGVENGMYATRWQSFAQYPTDGGTHKIAFAYAGPLSGVGSGSYKGCVYACDEKVIASCDSLIQEGGCIKRINIGGFQSSDYYPLVNARITRIKVFPRALTTAELEKETGEDDDPTYDAEVLASFFGFDLITSGAYTANLNANTVKDGKVTLDAGAIKLTSTNTWMSADAAAISVLVKYSNFTQPSGNAALVTIRNSAAGSMDSGVGVYSKNGDNKVHGIWQGGAWGSETTQTSESIGESGYLVFVYKGGKDSSGRGTYLYDGTGAAVYAASGLMSSSSQTIGDMLTIGALGDNTMLSQNTVIEGARIFKGALAADEIVAAVEDFDREADPSKRLSQMYFNRLSEESTDMVPAGIYGVIAAPNQGIKATAFATATKLSNTPSEEEIGGSYTNIIKKVGMATDIATHTLMGWFKVATLPTMEGADNAKTIYVAKSMDPTSTTKTHLGYKVAVDSAGKIYVGQCDDEAWRNDSGRSTQYTTDACVEEGQWFHLAISVTKSSGARLATARIFVNGLEVETADGPFGSNLNGTMCSYVRIGADISAAGIYVDTAALSDVLAIVYAAKHYIVEGSVPTAEIVKDDKTSTWSVDTTDAAYAFTSGDMADLLAKKWTVTLKSSSENAATISFGERSGSQPSHYIFESGEHNFTWIGTAANMNFNKTGTAEDPSILVKDGATLNFVVRDITGWNGSATERYFNLIRVNGGGTLNILPYGTMTHYFQGRYWLDPGAVVNVGEYEAYEFRLNGGAVSGYEQLYVPDSEVESAPVEMTVATGLKSASDNTAGLGIFVGTNSTLNINGNVGSDAAAPIGKWGAGTFAINGSTESLSGTLTVHEGTLKLTGNTLAGSLVAEPGTTVELTYDGDLFDGAVILSAGSVEIEGATVRINGDVITKIYFDGGKLRVGNPPITTCLNPYAVREGETIKVSCNEEATPGEAAKAFDGDETTYFEPGDYANLMGVSWTGIEFTNEVIVTGVSYSGNTPKRMIGGAFQGANESDFSDAVNIHVVETYAGGKTSVSLTEAKGPFKYLRFQGMYGGNVREIKFYGLADSGTSKPVAAPVVTDCWSKNGVAGLALAADDAVPQVYIVQRAMADFCKDDDYETFVTLAPQTGKNTLWNDTVKTGYAKYRVRGFNANGVSDWTNFDIVPEKLIADGPEKPTFGNATPGFYASATNVTISYEYAGAKIYYTTDGSMPTTNDTLYTGPIPLEDVCSRPNNLANIETNPSELHKNTSYGWRAPTEDQPDVNVIRARAFLEDGSASKFDVAGTWLIGPTVDEHQLRVVSIQTDFENYFSDPTGIMVPGDIYKSKGFGGHSVGMPNANYFQSGDAWERPTQIEIFETNRTEMLAAPIGTRVRGFWSRSSAKKSLTCYFRKEYGVKNAKIQLFRDEGVKKFKRFLLRNGGNDWYLLCLRDAVGQSMFRGRVNTDTQGYEPSVLYVNGEYWGLYNLRHCYSKHHFEEWSGGVGDDIDYVKLTPEDGTHFELQEGDFSEMWNIMQYMIRETQSGEMSDEAYAEVANRVDIDDMIDYHIMNIFIGNNDWMGNGNNMGFWRNRSGDDQKWHFTVYDCDSSQNLGGGSDQKTDHLKSALNVNDTKDSNTKMAPGFLKRCFMNPGFKRYFANRYADLLNTALKVERTTNIVAQAAARIDHEMDRTTKRWTNMGSYANWKTGVNRLFTFYKERPGYAFNHILSHCEGGSLASITLTNSVGNGAVKLNTITSGEHFELPFTGQYFTDIPVTLTAIPESGSEFAGWKIGDEVISTEPTMTLTPTNGVTIKAMFQAGGANPQQALRLVEIYGSTNEELHPGGDEGEFVIITNTSAQTVGLTGMVLKSEKNKSGYTTSLEVVIPNGEVPALGTYKLEQATLWSTQKISNGKIRMTLTDSDGVEIQVGNTEFTGDADGKGASMVADNLENPCDAWHVGPIHDPSPTPPPGPGGEYTLSGKLTNDVTFTSSSNVVVTLNNVTSENYKLTLEGAGVFTIYYPEGTTNSFTMKNNAAALIATNAAGVVITGPGVGNFKSTKKITDFGIIAAKDLTVEGGTTTVTFDQDKPTTSCIYLTGNYWQKGGTMNVVMPKVNTTNEFNGVLLYNKKTYAKIDGGAFNATVGGTKSNAIKLKGSCNGYFYGGTMTASLIGPQARVTNGGTQTFTDGGYVVTMPEDYTSLTNARVFKVDKALTISGGTFDITVPSEGSEAFATEEGVMTISGGTFRVLTGNDCVSAEVGFKMTGGTFYGTSTGNDVIDSNEDIEITGGLLLAYTTAVEEDGYGSLGLDVNIGHALTISGGTVVALGGPNAKWPDGCDFQQPGYTNVELDASVYSEKYLVLECEKTKTTARLPKITKQTFALLVSAPTLKGPATTTETEPKVAPVAEGIPAWVESVGDDVITGYYPDGTNIVLTTDATIKIGNATFGKALKISGGNPTIEMQPDARAFIPTINAGAYALTINGAGTLMMTNSTALITCGDLIVTNGTMDLIFDSQTAKDKAIVLTGDFKQYGGAISLTLASNVQLFGIYSNAKDKMAYIYGGTFDAVVAGGEKSAAIKMNKGSSDITIEGGAITATMSGVAPRFANTDGNIKIKGGTIEVSTVEGLGANANVFSAKNGLKISGGVITGEATGEGSEVFSADEAIEIKDGVISVESADDCFSAASIAITGGKVQGLSTGGDAIDAKGDVTIDGGYVFATTCFTNGYGIAADGKFVVYGGNVVAVGAPNFIHAPDEGSIACYTNASIAKLKKYLELTSDYIDHTEKLSVNLKEGEKRCTDGLSLVAVVPNMYGTYTDTKDKPTDVDPKHAKKLDPNLDGVFVTTVEKTTPSIVPGSTSASYDTEEAATNMAAQTTVSRPAEVAQSGAISEDAYADLFNVTVVQTAMSTWELVPELKPTVSNEVQAAANAAVTSAELIGTLMTAEPTAKVTTQAGLFYGLAASEALNDVGTVALPFAKWVLGTGGEQQLKADKPGESSGFYQIRVQIDPPKP